MAEHMHATLQTERLRLRPFALTDVDDVLAYAVLEEWSRYLDLAVPHPYVRRDAEEFIARRLLDDWSASAHFALESDGRVIGSVEMRTTRDDVAFLGYGLAPDHWGRGLMTEALKAVLEYGFAIRHLARIEAWADLRNRGSWRVMEKSGMSREGIFRSARLDRWGGRSDDVHYAILREEWDAAVRSQT